MSQLGSDSVIESVINSGSASEKMGPHILKFLAGNNVKEPIDDLTP